MFHVHVGHACGQDETGKVIELCNDGNVYCGITTFDWTQPKVRELWMRAVQNATETGQLILLPSPGVSNEGGSSPLLPPLVRCFLGLGSGLGLVGTASARR